MEARDRVIAGNQRAAQLEEQVEILRGQLQLGLKQRDLHFGAVKAQSAAETDRYRVQNKLLLEQARLTDDAVRRKAAQYIPLKKDNDRLKENLYEEETKVAKLQRRNEELVDQVDLLRARQMGVFGDEDDSSGTEGDSSSPLGHRDPAQLGYSVRPAGVASSSEVFSSLQILPEVLQVAEDIGFQVMQEMEPGSTVLGKAESQESLVEGGSGVRCKWRQEGVQCAVILDTFQVSLRPRYTRNGAYSGSRMSRSTAQTIRQDGSTRWGRRSPRNELIRGVSHIFRDMYHASTAVRSESQRNITRQSFSAICFRRKASRRPSFRVACPLP